MLVRKALAGLSAIVLLTTACGSDGSTRSASSPTSTTIAATTTTTATPPDPTEIVLPGEEPPQWMLPWQGGFLAVYTHHVETPFPELTDVQTERLPQEVRDLFAGDPPETLGESFGRVIEADLVGLMSAFFEENPDLAELILDGDLPDDLSMWQSSDGSDWVYIGRLEPPLPETVFDLASDGEHLVLVGETARFATTDLIGWEKLPVPLTSASVWPANVDPGSKGWVAAVQDDPAGTTSLYLAEWGEDAVIIDVPGHVEKLARTASGAMAISFTEDGDVMLLEVNQFTGTVIEHHQPVLDHTSVIASAGDNIVVAGAQGTFRMEPGVLAPIPVELPGVADSTLEWRGWFPPRDPGQGFAMVASLTSANSNYVRSGPAVVATVDGENWLIDNPARHGHRFANAEAAISDGHMLVWSDFTGLIYEIG